MSDQSGSHNEMPRRREDGHGEQSEHITLPAELGAVRAERTKESEGPPSIPIAVRTGKKSFEVQSVSDAPAPQNGRIPFKQSDVLLSSRMGSPEEMQNAQLHMLFIEEFACRSIFRHIGWKNPQSENSVEQGGWLLGEIIETEKDVFCGIVKTAIPAVNGEGSSTYLRLGHDSWKAMYDQLDAESVAGNVREPLLIGWYHTHPNELPVFMSSTDLNTQRTMFSKPWQFAVVLNPHRRIWAAFRGADAMECPGFIVKEKEPENAVSSRPKLQIQNNVTSESGCGTGTHKSAWQPLNSIGRILRGPVRTIGALTVLTGGLILLLLVPVWNSLAFSKKKFEELEGRLRLVEEEIHRRKPNAVEPVPVPAADEISSDGEKPGALKATGDSHPEQFDSTEHGTSEKSEAELDKKQ